MRSSKCWSRRAVTCSSRCTRFVVGTMAALSLLVIAGTASAADCWLPPVDAPVVDPFRPPLCTWCAGNRGLEYGTPGGTAVRAVAAGEVTFSGTGATQQMVVRGPGHLHFGLRDGDVYLDPAPYLGRLVGRPRLVPDDGTVARPAPPPRLRCG